MNRSDRRKDWEALLGEPVAAVGSVRVVSAPGNFAGSRAAAVLTDSRFVLIGSRNPLFTPKPKSGGRDRTLLEFPRPELTDAVREPRRILTLRYMSGTEQTLRLRCRDNPSTFLILMEPDLSGDSRPAADAGLKKG